MTNNAVEEICNAIKEICEEAVKAVDLTPDGIAAFLKSHPEYLAECGNSIGNLTNNNFR